LALRTRCPIRPGDAQLTQQPGRLQAWCPIHWRAGILRAARLRRAWPHHRGQPLFQATGSGGYTRTTSRHLLQEQVAALAASTHARDRTCHTSGKGRHLHPRSLACGEVSHTSLQPNSAPPVAPSAIRGQGQDLVGRNTICTEIASRRGRADAGREESRDYRGAS